MKRKRILELIGFRFIVNHKTNEIHRVRHITKNCMIQVMTNGRYNTKWRVKKLMKRNERYNGCRYCYKEKDTG